MQSFAEQREGRCLSETYKYNKTKLKWQCKEGHVWAARYNDVSSSRSWCPECKLWKTQKELYNNVKKLYPEASVHINYKGFEWLRSPDTNYLLEIDIFVEDRAGSSIAIEYHGEQHFRPVEYFGGKENFEKIKYRDSVKETLINESSDVGAFVVFKSGEPVWDFDYVKKRLRNV